MVGSYIPHTTEPQNHRKHPVHVDRVVKRSKTRERALKKGLVPGGAKAAEEDAYCLTLA
jgi:hypothetical protein